MVICTVILHPFAVPYNVPVNLISAIIMTAVSVLTGMLTTKIKYYETEKAESERERMRANLLRAVSHDLRTPLTTIYSASSTLRSKKNVLTEDQQDTMLKNNEEDSEWLVRKVTLDIPEDVVVVSVDTLLIEQVLMNLLENLEW